MYTCYVLLFSYFFPEVISLHISWEPELQKVGWAQRLPLASLVYYEQWGQQSHPNWTPLPFPKDE